MKYDYMPTKLKKFKSWKIPIFLKDMVLWVFLHANFGSINLYNYFEKQHYLIQTNIPLLIVHSQACSTTEQLCMQLHICAIQYLCIYVPRETRLFTIALFMINGYSQQNGYKLQPINTIECYYYGECTKTIIHAYHHG